mgnify:CR=1 FL=1
MRAINKYIIINKLENETRTSSGLILSGADMKDFRYRMGEVVIPGTEVLTVKKGDRIYYDKSAGHEMIIKDKPYTIIREADVVVVLD